jgi:hypothetical protein
LQTYESYKISRNFTTLSETGKGKKEIQWKKEKTSVTNEPVQN